MPDDPPDRVVELLPYADGDRDALIDFFASNRFPFHVRPDYSREQASARVDRGDLVDDEHATYWVHVDGRPVGVVTLQDLQDDAPLFDLRLVEAERGRGLGVPVLRAVTALVFERHPRVRRFEGQTRDDNIAMRRTFVRAGFVKEAHYREGWPTVDGPRASVAYAILRRDWETGTTTPLVWDDLPD